MSVTICDLANFILGREATTGQDFADAGLAILGGCQRCGASIAAYNAYPTQTGFWRCEDCVGDLGYPTVEEAKTDIWDRRSDADGFLTFLNSVSDKLRSEGFDTTVETMNGYIALYEYSFGVANSTWGWNDEEGNGGESEIPGDTRDLEAVIKFIKEIYSGSR